MGDAVVKGPTAARQRALSRRPLAVAAAALGFGLLVAGAASAGEGQPRTLYPMPVPSADVIWAPPTAQQRGFRNPAALGEGQALPKVRRTGQDSLVAKPGPTRLLYVAIQEGTLQMQAEPRPDAASRGAYPTGTRMIILEDEGEWMRVLAPDGRWGWMAAEYLAETLGQEAQR